MWKVFLRKFIADIRTCLCFVQITSNVQIHIMLKMCVCVRARAAGIYISAVKEIHSANFHEFYSRFYSFSNFTQTILLFIYLFIYTFHIRYVKPLTFCTLIRFYFIFIFFFYFHEISWRIASRRFVDCCFFT